MFVPHRRQASTVFYGKNFTLLYVDDVRTSQETQASTVCYGENFTLLYVDDVRTSQETQASTVCYGESFTFLVYFSALWCMCCETLVLFTVLGPEFTSGKARSGH
jgi:hypothetical protein